MKIFADRAGNIIFSVSMDSSYMDMGLIPILILAEAHGLSGLIIAIAMTFCALGSWLAELSQAAS